MTTKTRPTPKKLPRARVMHACSRDLANLETLIAQPKSYGPTLDVPLAVIPTHTAAQAKRIVKLAPFLQMTEEEQVERLAKMFSDDVDDGTGLALSVLRCMGLGGRGGK